ncbi:MAG: bifunctional hydroxymethylpyrimidine kinase/phosphomethylpyrimidine kinase [Candidatus Porifericomitaceae bacterium WSBS_2022_MAG_OTU9]
MATQPIVLAIGGHDPCGAGLQADIKSIIGCNAHPVTLVTALTAQNSNGLKAVFPQQAQQLWQQASLLLEESKVDAIKIGVIADAKLLPVIIKIIETARQQVNKVPVVLDPVLACSAGGAFADATLQQQMLDMLLPLCTVVTPNHKELLTLGKGKTIKMAVETLLARGTVAILASDQELYSDTIVNRLYGSQGIIAEYIHERLPLVFHGSGCTMAASFATHLAHCGDLGKAFALACEYTEKNVRDASAYGSR